MNQKGEQKQLWDGTYSSQTDFFGIEASEIASRSIALFRKHSCNKILELGCGQGRDTWYLVRAGFRVCALDYSETGICQMKEKSEIQGLNCELQVHDALDPLPFPDEDLDAIYSHMFFTMHFTMDELEKMMQECLRVLRPGGLHVYSVRNTNDPHYGKFTPVGEDAWQNPLGFAVRFFSEEKIRALSKGYEIVSIREFQDGSPPFTKTLYEVVLQKPQW